MAIERASQTTSKTGVIWLAAIAIALYLGRDVAIPFALSILFSFLLTPLVNLLERARIGRIPAVVVVLALVLSLAISLVWIGGRQISGLAMNIPQYQKNIRGKLERARFPAGAMLQTALYNVDLLSAEISKNSGKPATSSGSEPIHPVPVTVVKPQSGWLDSVGLVSSSLLHFVESAVAVLILTMFILMRRSDLRNRIFRLFGQAQVSLITSAMDDAADRVSQYLLSQTAVNGVFGLCYGVCLWLLGVPSPVFWGCLAVLLRFIPYLGTLVAGLCPIVLAIAVFPGWSKPLMAFGAFGAIELSVSLFIEPWLYGMRTGISSLAVLLSAAFWTALWGPIGLVVATPLTVCLVVLGRHVPQFQFMYVLLGDEPVLSPEVCYYQRLLAGDEAEAREVVEQWSEQHSVANLFDEVLIPALAIAQQDLRAGGIDERRLRFLYATTRDLIEEYGEQTAFDASGSAVTSKAPCSVLCIPARDEADELTCLMLERSLRVSGYQAETTRFALTREMLEQVSATRPDVLFICALPSSLSHARSLCRRVGKISPETKSVVALWGLTSEDAELRERLGSGCGDHVIGFTSQAELQLRLLGFGALEESPDGHGLTVGLASHR